MTRWPITAALCAATVLFATAAAAQPFPGTSVVPPWIPLVGTIGGAPDPSGTRTVVVNDPIGIPIPGALVTISFAACCDLNLCTAAIGGQLVNCPFNTLSGFTDAAGAFTFTAIGAAKDPGTAGAPLQMSGCGFGGIVVTASAGGGPPVVLGTSSSYALDLNGAAPGGSNGTTVSDVGNLLNLYGSVALGNVYRARGDLNMDGRITVADVARMANALGALALAGGTGCPTAAFCATPPCPIE